MTGHPETYNAAFYSKIGGGSSRAAETIVPLVLDLVHPARVIDVGCGTGVWLAEFCRRGVTDILGVDGDWVPRDQLQIGPDRFISVSLEGALPVTGTFDLAVSLEVAEHLPENQASDFVRSLTSLAPVVLFSAAIPYQAGSGHVNCRWQSWWARLFLEHDYHPIDTIRERVWSNAQVDFWYAQNMLLYASSREIASSTKLSMARKRTSANQLDLVHPRMYLSLANDPTVSPQAPPDR